MTDCPSRCQDIISTTTTTTYLTRDQTTPLPQVATYRKNHNLFHYFVLTGVSAVSSESTSSRKCSLTRDFSFSSLSNFQNVNLLDKSQIPRSKVSFLKRKYYFFIKNNFPRALALGPVESGVPGLRPRRSGTALSLWRAAHP